MKVFSKISQYHKKITVSVQIRENTDQKKLCIWTFFTQRLAWYIKGENELKNQKKFFQTIHEYFRNNHCVKYRIFKYRQILQYGSRIIK